MKNGIDILITDLDNTIYNFVDYFGPAIRALVHVVSKSTKTDENLIFEDLKNIVRQFGSLEHKYVLEHLECIARQPYHIKEQIIRNARIAFDRSRKKRLTPYQDIEKVLKELKRRGVYIVGLTNAPMYHVIRRLRYNLGMFNLFDGLVAFEGYEQHIYSDRVSTFEREFTKAKKRLDFLIAVSDEHLKPSTFPFTEIAANLPKETAKIYCLGDSKHKDLTPGKCIGATTIWARYGVRINEMNRDTLLRVTPWSQKQVQLHFSDDIDSIDYTIDSPNELLGIINGSQGQTWPTRYLHQCGLKMTGFSGQKKQ